MVVWPVEGSDGASGSDGTRVGWSAVMDSCCDGDAIAIGPPNSIDMLGQW